MIGQLYQTLLHLLPRDFRQQFGDEMYSVFLEACSDARQQGVVAYGVFAGREVIGIVIESIVNRAFVPRPALYVPGCGLAGLTLALLVSYGMGNTYTSTAVMRFRPGLGSQLVANRNNAPAVPVKTLMYPVMSRSSLSSLLLSLNLYPGDRQRQPIEAVVQKMVHSIRMMPDKHDGSFQVSFRYADPKLARKVTEALVANLIHEFFRVSTVQARMTVEFLKEQADRAGVAFEKQMAAYHAAVTSGRSTERLQLDAELARNEYATLREKLTEADLMANLTRLQQGPVLELLDPPSLPSTPDAQHQWIGVGGMLGGTFVGLGLWLRRLRLRRTPAVVPES